MGDVLYCWETQYVRKIGYKIHNYIWTSIKLQINRGLNSGWVYLWFQLELLVNYRADNPRIGQKLTFCVWSWRFIALKITGILTAVVIHICSKFNDELITSYCADKLGINARMDGRTDERAHVHSHTKTIHEVQSWPQVRTEAAYCNPGNDDTGEPWQQWLATSVFYWSWVLLMEVLCASSRENAITTTHGCKYFKVTSIKQHGIELGGSKWMNWLIVESIIQSTNEWMDGWKNILSINQSINKPINQISRHHRKMLYPENLYKKF